MAMQKNKAFGDKIITGECRASFPKLAKPDDSKFGQNKYSIDGIFESKAEMKTLMQQCKDHAMAFYGTVEGIKFPWKDGGSQSKYAGYEGNQFIRVRSKQKPTIVDKNRKPFDASEVYGGCVVRINCTPLAYEMDEEIIEVVDGVRKKVIEKIKGVTVLLNAVQFIRDGESFGGGNESGGGFDDNYKDEDSESVNEMF